MKHSLIYPASLALLLAVSTSYGGEWERKLNSTLTAQSQSGSASTLSYDWSDVNANRQRQLGRSAHSEGAFDIESLPPTAAGQFHTRDMPIDWKKVEANRRMQLERGM